LNDPLKDLDSKHQRAQKLQVHFCIRDQFHQTFTCKFYVQKSFRQLILLTCNKRKAAEKMFVRKIRAKNVYEIDTSSLQFSLK
jgi:hypothetical protein